MSYGKHICLDIELYEPRAWEGVTAYQFLIELVESIEMNPIGLPHVDLYSGDKDWQGPSATIHIQTSHCTLHYFDKGYMFMDVFSCKDFDDDKIIQLLKNYLGDNIKSIERHEVHRGKHFPW